MHPALSAALAAMVVYLDTTALGQFMICQPVIACPAFGWLIGRPEIGLFFGVAFQLIWLGSLPVGAAKFPEGNVGAVIATAAAASVPPAAEGEPAWIVIAIATMIGILTAYIGGELTPQVRRIMNEIAARFADAAADGRAGRVRALFWGALSIHAATGFCLGLVCFIGGTWLLKLYLGPLYSAGVSASLLATTDSLLSGLWPALLGIGAAVIVQRFVRWKSVPMTIAVGAVALLAGWIWLS